MNLDEILEVLNGDTNKRGRQKQIGPSEIGGCRRAVWHRVQGTPVVSPQTKRLAANMGTAIHRWIERQFDLRDPFETRYLREVEVEYDGLMGHVDLYDKQDHMIVDWKTTRKSKLSNFPSVQQFQQVHIYGYLMTMNGYEVDEVALVGIARDGNEDDVRFVKTPYDPKIAAHGIQWLADVRALDAAPEPERNRRFCREYCVFYDPTGEIGCEGAA